MIDTHAHLYEEKYENDLTQVIERATSVGINKIYMPNVDAGSVLPMLGIAERYAKLCVPMLGLHPCYVKEDYRDQLEALKKWLNTAKFAAIGEIGTDLFWDKTTIEWQKEAFNIQCDWALEYDLPIVIHCRESIDLTIELVSPLASKGLKGIFHCFTGSYGQAKTVIDLGFLLGIGGVATFKNGGITEVINKVPMTSIVLETDSPYLAPAPNRGKRNEPSFLPIIAHKIKEIRGIDLGEVIHQTTQNAENIFKL